MPFSYAPRVAGSTFEPIALQVLRDGVVLPSLGVEVTVTIKERNRRAIVVENAAATASSSTPGRWEYYFNATQMALVLTGTTWLIEWTIKVGDYLWRTETAQMIVRRRL